MSNTTGYSNKLGLGTAQFGMNYGRFNAHGRPGKDEVSAILSLARDMGVRIIDTAHLYGDSETVLGNHLPTGHPFRIVTKTPHFQSGRITKMHADLLNETFAASLAKLNTANTYGLLAHNSEDLLASGGEYLFEAMAELREKDRVARIGASVYTGDQIERLLQKFELDLIQLPMNVLDQRLVTRNILRDLASRGIEVHVRSAYLQGLLLANPDVLPPFFASVRSTIRQFQEAARAAGRTPAQAALDFLCGLPEVHAVLVGIESPAQLAEIATAPPAADSEIDFTQFSISDEKILNPSMWQ